MHRKLKELLNYKIEGTDGKIGSIYDFYFDEKIWTIRYMVVNTGNFLFRNLVLISPIFIEDIETDEKIIKISLTKDQVKHSPDIDSARPISRQHEITLMDYYNAGYYWAGFDTWGMYQMPVSLRGINPKRKKENKENNKTSTIPATL